jgi:protein-tyrosine phosphatase
MFMRLTIVSMLVLAATSATSAFGDSSDVEQKYWGPPPPSEWGRNNLHLIERDPSTGFEIYRTSKPDREDMRKFCALGITEMVVLSGTADDHEYKYREECPTLRVVYNFEQTTGTPLSVAFLKSFDTWVENARRAGKKIAFRCECGCHRTGRLAAYYQMKYQHMSLNDALEILEARGEWMLFYPHIFKQTRALADYIAGRPCSQKAKYCVRP